VAVHTKLEPSVRATVIAIALLPNPVGASNITYLQPELKASQICLITLSWLFLKEVCGKFPRYSFTLIDLFNL